MMIIARTLDNLINIVHQLIIITVLPEKVAYPGDVIAYCIIDCYTFNR